MQTGSSDLDLIHRANGGDKDAFEKLYYRYREWVFSLACRFCGNEHDAADVLQDTFFYFLNKFPGFKLTCRLKTFLYPVVTHLALSCKEKGKKTAPVEAEDIPARPVRDENRERSELAEAVRQLPAHQREVVMLKFADGLELTEIARALDIPVGTVKSRLHNALERLRAADSDNPRHA